MSTSTPPPPRSDAPARPTPRRRQLVALLIASALLMWFAAEAVRLWQIHIDAPVQTTAHRDALQAFLLEGMPPGADGWPALASEIAAIRTRALSAEASRIESTDSLDAPEVTVLTSDDLARVDTLLHGPRIVPPPLFTLSGEFTLEYHTDLRLLARQLKMFVETATDARDTDAVRHALRLLRRTTMLASQVPLEIHVLVWSALHTQESRAVMDAVHAGVFDDADLTALQRSWQSEASGPVLNAERVIEAESIFTRETLRSMYGSRGYLLSTLRIESLWPGMEYYDTTGDSRSWNRTLIARFSALRHDDAVAFHNAFNTWLRTTALTSPPSSRNALVAQWIRTHLPRDREPMSADALLRRVRTLDTFDSIVATRHATVLFIAAHRHARTHGSFPTTLDALVPEFVAEIPIDPRNGLPFQYECDGDSVVLRSVGPDGMRDTASDDQGVLTISSGPGSDDIEWTPRTTMPPDS